jgi:hypothetical protein
MSHHFEHHKEAVTKLLSDTNFLASLQRDVFKGIPENEVDHILRDAITCIVKAPQGVGKMESTKKHPHIKNSMWRAMCEELLGWLKMHCKKELDAAIPHSSLHKQFGGFWPECDLAMQEVMDSMEAPGGGVQLKRRGAIKGHSR